MDFGVSGNIKKVSHGPVVTLNEFEPAAGVKVSKIINLSDDIARNTSSESARIAQYLEVILLVLNFQITLEKMFI
jgi:S-DNA-T family DNA segregation ATPase FtsK/SpoIIIE